MGRKRHSAVLASGMAALLLLVAGGAVATAASPTVYVGDAKQYSVAFKAEEGQVYVLELAGSADCYYTEPHEDVGQQAFSVFPAPTLMHQGPKALTAEESGGSLFGGWYSTIRANLSGDQVTGTYSYDESEESFHCDTGFSETPFAATRYEPAGAPGAAPPKAGETRVYYGSEEPIEAFLRADGKVVGGIRGTFVSQCPVGRRQPAGGRYALFAHPAFAKRGDKSGFRRHVESSGRTHSGVQFRESISIAGRVEDGAISGTYTRVRTSKPKKGQAQRCATGPLGFRATRYLPAAGS
ncbi:MAG TPA: hypothetical protein VLL27_09735 [Solirubrobacterales bacterium]|nr:hypothetical protein [Solirubrobacterales bacterium]